MEKSRGKEEVVKKKDFKHKLILQSVKLPGYSEEVKLFDPSHAEELLGVFMAMDGNDSRDHRKGILQVQALSKNVSKSPLDRLDAETIYRERWVNSVGYGLPVTQFDEKQCEQIMKPFYAAILPKMGLIDTFHWR